MNAQSNKLSVLFGAGSLYTLSSGPRTALVQIAKRMIRSGHDVVVVGTKNRPFDKPPPDLEGVKTHTFWRIGPYSMHFAPSLPLWLRHSGLSPDAASFEGVWLWDAAAIGAWCRRRGIPYMIVAHGNFSPVILARSRLKKRLARWAFIDRFLAGAACFRALTRREVTDIRDYGIKQPIALIPNGIELTAPMPRAEARSKIPAQLRADRICLYLGRLDRVKGIDMLIKAWAALPGSKQDWRLVIAGDGSPDYSDYLLQTAQDAGIADKLTWPGYCDARAKQIWMSAADLFVLPSRSEGFAVAPLEAMSYGLPCILTETCNFPEAYEAGAAIRAIAETPSLSVALAQAVALPDAARADMAEAGRRLVRTRYSLESVCAQLELVYQWMAGRGERPACIDAG